MVNKSHIQSILNTLLHQYEIMIYTHIDISEKMEDKTMSKNEETYLNLKNEINSIENDMDLSYNDIIRLNKIITEL